MGEHEDNVVNSHENSFFYQNLKNPVGMIKEEAGSNRVLVGAREGREIEKGRKKKEKQLKAI